MGNSATILAIHFSELSLLLTNRRLPDVGPPAGPSRVYLVDDDSSVRRRRDPPPHASGYPSEAVGSAEAFLESARPAEVPSCLVVDLRMPGLSGLDLQTVPLEQGFDISLVFISGRADLESGIRA